MLADGVKWIALEMLRDSSANSNFDIHIGNEIFREGLKRAGIIGMVFLKKITDSAFCSG